MRHIHFDTIDSTNAYLKREHENVDSLTFISAAFQREGKGREERVWQSNYEENVLCSFIIKDASLIAHYSCLSIYTAMVICKYLESKGLQDVSIKWPNDVYVRGKKICGILLEGSIPNYVVVGFGLNVKQNEFPNDLRRPATSIELETGEKYGYNKVQEEVINKIYSFWATFNSKSDEYERYINEHNFLKGKRVKIVSDNELIEGTVDGINSNNELLIQLNNGEVTQISSGEIEII